MFLNEKKIAVLPGRKMGAGHKKFVFPVLY